MPLTQTTAQQPSMMDMLKRVFGGMTPGIQNPGGNPTMMDVMQGAQPAAPPPMPGLQPHHPTPASAYGGVESMPQVQAGDGLGKFFGDMFLNFFTTNAVQKGHEPPDGSTAAATTEPGAAATLGLPGFPHTPTPAGAYPGAAPATGAGPTSIVPPGMETAMPGLAAASKQLSGVTAPPAPQGVIASSPGAPQMKALGGQLPGLMTKMGASGASTNLPQLHRMLQGFRNV